MMSIGNGFGIFSGARCRLAALIIPYHFEKAHYGPGHFAALFSRAFTVLLPAISIYYHRRYILSRPRARLAPAEDGMAIDIFFTLMIVDSSTSMEYFSFIALVDFESAEQRVGQYVKMYGKYKKMRMGAYQQFPGAAEVKAMYYIASRQLRHAIHWRA